MFKAKKEYGNYKTDICPFCGGQAFLKNKVGLSVCKNHKDTEYPELKCSCGNWLDVLSGKFGTYCNCPRCGNINLSKALAMQEEIKMFKTNTNNNNSTNNNKNTIVLNNNILPKNVTPKPTQNIYKNNTPAKKTFSSEFERYEYERMRGT